MDQLPMHLRPQKIILGYKQAQSTSRLEENMLSF